MQGLRKSEQDVAHLHIDPPQMLEGCFGIDPVDAAQTVDQGLLKEVGGHATQNVITTAFAALLQGGGDIVPVALAARADCEGRRHPFSSGIEDTAGELASGPCTRVSVVSAARAGGQLLLHGIEKGPIDDRRVQAFVQDALVPDETEIDGIAKQMKQRPATEGPAGNPGAILVSPDLRTYPRGLERPGEVMNGAKVEIAPEDAAHCLGLPLVDDKPPSTIARPVVAEGQVAAHPHAAGLGGRDLVADAFACDFSFELGEGQEHVEAEPTH